jgi:hypothetical protein
MQARSRWTTAWMAWLAAILLTGCGGGGGDNASGPRIEQSQGDIVNEEGAPVLAGDTTIDGLNWFNFRRQQAGLSLVTRDPLLDNAARGHSEYQRINEVVSHEQEPGKPGFTGATPGDRIDAAGYQFQQRSYAFGEVISAATNPSGAFAADALVTAIYHRFVILEPVFNEVGGGSSSEAGGYTWFTAKFAADGLTAGLGRNRFVTWPAASQTNIPTVFLTDSEIPDPLPDQNAAGYPISIHADITSRVTVQQFTLHQRGGAALPVRLLTSTSDGNTPPSVAAIVPLDTLLPNTVYEARFIGLVDELPVNHTWTFTTR